MKRIFALTSVSPEDLAAGWETWVGAALKNVSDEFRAQSLRFDAAVAATFAADLAVAESGLAAGLDRDQSVVELSDRSFADVVDEAWRAAALDVGHATRWCGRDYARGVEDFDEPERWLRMTSALCMPTILSGYYRDLVGSRGLDPVREFDADAEPVIYRSDAASVMRRIAAVDDAVETALRGGDPPFTGSPAVSFWNYPAFDVRDWTNARYRNVVLRGRVTL